MLDSIVYIDSIWAFCIHLLKTLYNQDHLRVSGSEALAIGAVLALMSENVS